MSKGVTYTINTTGIPEGGRRKNTNREKCSKYLEIK